jgi:DNA invertase Pin-like site-specific DNA recombinase
MMSAAIYVRASTELQKYSTTNQTDALMQYASEHDLAVVKTYEDDGRSGLDLDGRPGLLQLLQDVLAPAPKFEVLLVYDVSRWGRFQDTDEGAHYEFLCRRAGVRIVYCAEPFENDGSAMAGVMKAIKRTMAAEYSRELSLKVARGKRKIAEMGYNQAMPCLGLRRLIISDKGTPKGLLERGERKAVQSDRIVLVPGPRNEIAAVRWIFHMFVRQRLGYQHIANALNEKGVPTVTGGRWCMTSVRGVLVNEQCVGTLVFGRTTQRLRGRRVQMPPDTWIRRPRVFEGIVPQATFLHAQKRIAEGINRRTDNQMLAPLRSLFEREGYLTARLINNAPSTLSASAYLLRFRSLYEVYRRVGYEPTRANRPNPGVLRNLPPEAMLDRLRTLLNRRGYLTATMIDNDPETPGFHVIRATFGSLKAAYKLIGYEPPPLTKSRPRRSDTKGSYNI